MAAKDGDTVVVEYEGRLESGELFDTSKEDLAKEEMEDMPAEEQEFGPLEFTIGDGEVIEGFEEAVVGMEEGDTKEVEIPPEKGYGERDDEFILVVSTDDLQDQGIEPEEGLMVATDEGSMGEITNIEGGNATVDFNHPLAGKTLHFTIELEEIK